MLKRENMYAYQTKGVNFIKDKKRCALFLDMGLGKTATTLTAISDLLTTSDVKKVLIIAPLRVANTVWKQECYKWEHLQGLDVKICTGSLSERTRAIEGEHDIYVINREQVEWLVKHKSTWDFDAIVIDESTSFKNSSSKRFKALKKVALKTKYLVLLTGTPSPQGIIDLWAQLYLIDGGARLCRSKTNFLNMYFNQDYFGYTYTPIQGADRIIKDKIKDVCLTMLSEDYLELPEVIYSTEYVELPSSVARKYKELKEEMVLTLSEEIDIVSPSAAALNNKLLQMCSGALYDEFSNYHVLHDEKIKALKDLVENNPNENLLVAYNFKSDKDRLLKAFPDAVELDKQGKVLDDWNKGKIKMLIAHPMSAGHGLNMQYGGNTLVYFSTGWSLEYYQQFNKRLHRNGQKNTVKIIHIVVKGGVDEAVMTALSSKATTQAKLLESLKNYYT